MCILSHRIHRVAWKALRLCEGLKGYAIILTYSSQFGTEPDIAGFIIADAPHNVVGHSPGGGKCGKSFPVEFRYTAS